MEAVPRLPMLKFEPKKCIDQPVFTAALKKYIRNHYNEDPESYTSELQELEQLRSSVAYTRQDFEYCSLLRRYFCQLHYLLARFPINQPDTDLTVTFHWQDVYSPSSAVQRSQSADMDWERAAVLYNVAVQHLSVGCGEDRSTPQGMKVACTHFQCAAWAFQHLRDALPQPATSDLSPALAGLMHTVALAQAQECILEKSISDNRKPAIIAKVSQQVVEYLRAAGRALDTTRPAAVALNDTAGAKRVKTWARYCEFKQAYYQAVTRLYLGLQAEEQKNVGERIAYLQDAAEKLAAAAKLAKNMDGEELIRECLSFSHDFITGKLTAAQKENEFIFHEKVPDIATLPEVKGASLVKGIPFSFTDTDVSGPDIFRRLIPMEAHQASSMYSEEKAQLLRRIGARVAERNEELDIFLATLQLDDLLDTDHHDNLPQELVSACAELNARDAITELTQQLASIAAAHAALVTLLSQHQATMQEEDERLEEFRLAVGDPKAPNTVWSSLRRESDRCRAALLSAQESNAALDAAAAAQRPRLATLSKPLQQVAATLTSVVEATKQTGETGVESRAQLQRLMKKVEEMQAQRLSVESQLRQNLHDDDITGALVTADQDNAELFKDHLKKHDHLVSVLEQNLVAQTAILQAVSEANAAHASTRRAVKQASAQRDREVADLLAAHGHAGEVASKARLARTFYDKLHEQVTNLLKRTQSVMSVQEEERQSMMAAQAKKFLSLSKRGKQPPAVPGSVTAPFKPPSSAFSSHALHGPLSSQTRLPAATTGPKLKDFLKADGGFKGLSGAIIPSASAGVSATSVGATGAGAASGVVGVNNPGYGAATVYPGTIGYSQGGTLPYQYTSTAYPSVTPAYTPAPNVYSTTPVSQSNTSVVTTTPSTGYLAQPQTKPQPPQVSGQQQPQQSYQTQSQPQPTSVDPYMARPAPVGSELSNQYGNKPSVTGAASAYSCYSPSAPSPAPSPGVQYPPTQAQTPTHQYPATQTQYPSTQTQYPRSAVTSQTNYSTTQAQYAATQAQYAATQAQYAAAGTRSQYPATQTQYPTTQTQYPTTQTQYPTSQTQYVTTQSQIMATQTQAQYTAGQAQYTATQTQYPATQTQYPKTQAQYSSTVTTASQHPYSASQAQYTSGQTQVSTTHNKTGTTQAQYNSEGQSQNVIQQQQQYVNYPGSYGTPRPLQQSALNGYTASPLPNFENYMSSGFYNNTSFTPNPCPPGPGTGNYTPSVSIATGMRSPTMNIISSSNRNSSTAAPAIYTTSSNNATTVLSGESADKSMYRYPSSGYVVPSYCYAQAGARRASQNDTTPSAAASPLTSPGYNNSGQPDERVVPVLGVAAAAVAASGSYTIGATSNATVNTTTTTATTGTTQHQPQYPATAGAGLPGIAQQQPQYQPTATVAASGVPGPTPHQQQYQHYPAAVAANSAYATQHQYPQNTAVSQQPDATNVHYRQQLEQPNLQSPHRSPQHQPTAQSQHISQQQQQQQYKPQQLLPSDTISPKPVSNLDLLSGIDMSGTSSQWGALTPLMPQSVPSTKILTAGADSHPNTTAGTAITSAINRICPDNTTNATLPSTLNSHSATLVSNVDKGTSSINEVANFVQEQLGKLHITTGQGDGSAVGDTNSQVSTATTGVASSVFESITALARTQKPPPPRPLDPLDDEATLAVFVEATERLAKTVEGLDRRSLNGGPTNLEIKWREIQEQMDAQSDRSSRPTVSVGRCYPRKNRFPDILPYDHSRVVLTNGKDDYINASHVNVGGNGQGYPAVVSQAPTLETAADYWRMVWQLQAELILCLHTLPEIKQEHYWPRCKGPEGTMQFGDLTVTEHSSSDGGSGAWRQRLLHITAASGVLGANTSTTRAVIQLQFLGWQPGGVPASPAPLLQVLWEAAALQRQQRHKRRPVVITCVAGAARSCLVAALLPYLHQLHARTPGGAVSDVAGLCVSVGRARRGGLQDKDFLRFFYAAALYAAQDTLMKRGILTNKATFEEGPRESSRRHHHRHPSDDLTATATNLLRQKDIEKYDSDKTSFGEQESSKSPVVAAASSTTTPEVISTADEPDASTSSPQTLHSTSETCPTTSDVTTSDVTTNNVTPTSNGTVDASQLGGIRPVSSSLAFLPPNLAASVDPQQLKLEVAPPGRGEKITRQSFERRGSGSGGGGLEARKKNPDDPFSDIDPLWSLNKS